MPSQVTNYQCPSCTGPLHYSGESGKLECEYCGQSYDVEEIEKLYAEKEAEATAAKEEADKKEAEAKEESAEWGGEYTNMDQWGVEEGMKAYSCPSCGAQLICDETTAATSCPYCGNPSVVPGQFSGMKKPDFVLPFKLEKKQAIEALKNHYKGKRLLPNSFTDENHIEEIKGVYVPFWLFDADTKGDILFHATRSHSYKEGDYRVTDTEHYDVYRVGEMSFRGIPADGSSKMPDDYMDSIEPFDYSELKPFSTAYLPGFLADKYDVTADDVASRIEERCENSTVSCLQDTVVGYETISITSKEVNIKRGDVKYALMPVWLLSTKWNDQNYLFAMNGQTGKMVGNLPVDKKKARMWLFGVAAASAAVLSLFLSGPLGRMIMSFFN